VGNFLSYHFLTRLFRFSEQGGTMRIVTLDVRITPAALRRELRYTLVRLRHRSWAKPWVKTFEDLLSETELAEIDLRNLQDDQESADAELDEADLVLDILVLYTAKLVRAELNGLALVTLNKSLFGSETPSEMIRPKLGEELERVSRWPAVLAGAPLAKLVAHKTEVEAVVKRCEDAVSAHKVATAALDAYHVNSWVPFVNKVNGERQALGGDAKKQLHTDSVPGAATGLFRHAGRSRSSRSTTLHSVQSAISGLEEELTVLKEQETQLLAQQKADAEAAAELKKKAQELADLQRSQADTEAKVQKLKEELEKSRKR
jgi:hypothetical protein